MTAQSLNHIHSPLLVLLHFSTPSLNPCIMMYQHKWQARAQNNAETEILRSSYHVPGGASDENTICCAVMHQTVFVGVS